MKKIIISALLPIAFSACATIVASGPDRIPVNSTPQKAKVYLNGQYMGETPMDLVVERATALNVRLEIDGYEPVTLSRDKSLNGWTIGNILLGGVVGIAVDAATSNLTKHSTDPLVATFRTRRDDVAKGGNVRVPVERTPASAH